MDPLSALYIMLGVLVIAVRGPMIFAPTATLDFFRRVIASDRGVRTIAVVLAPLAWLLIALPEGSGIASGLLRGVGWIWALATVLLLLAPGAYRRLASGVLRHFEDPNVVRVIGVFSVALGAGLIYFGLQIA